MHRLHTNRAIPHTLENTLLLRGTGTEPGALGSEAPGTRPAEWPSRIVKSKARVVQEAEADTRRHGE